MLQLSIVRKLYRGSSHPLPVLRNMSFNASENETVVLLGPSGCGKTTLLKILAGLDHDFDGDIRWKNVHLPKIGFAFQEPRLLPWRTALDNLILVQPGVTGRDKAMALLDRLGLGPFADHWASQLSLGMARRLAFARALVIEPEVLLLDEAFVSLDQAMAATCHELLIELCRQRPVLTILVTHNVDEAVKLAGRVFVLSQPPSCIQEIVTIPAAIRDDPAAAETIATTLRSLLAAI